MSDEVITQIVRLFVVLLISLVFHEVAHAFVAKKLGDRTASDAGLVTLNPAPHIRREPFGTLLMPLFLLFMSDGRSFIGFAHVPIDAAWADRNPRKAAAVSIAGPLANIVLMTVAFAGLYLLVQNDVVDPWPSEGYMFLTPIDDDSMVRAGTLILTDFVWLNAFLAIFNLMPWPPLDASHVLGGLFPKTIRPFVRSISTTPLLAFGGLIVLAIYVVPEILYTVLRFLRDLL